jgi:hypothetical protein
MHPSGHVIFRTYQFLDYMRQHNSFIAIALLKVNVFFLDLSWIQCPSRYYISVWYVMFYEVPAAVIMVCSVGIVVATTTGRNEVSTQN